MWFRFICICLAVSFLTTVFGQTFQYSRGWKNGKRAGHSTRDTACQFQVLKSILEGKYIPQMYWPCEWHSFIEPDQSKKSTLPQQEQPLLSTDADEK